MEGFNKLGVFDFLEADSRPTFVLDAASPTSSYGFEPIFQNKALLSDDMGAAVSWHYTYSDFFQWVIKGQSDKVELPTYAFQGYVWNRFSVQNQWIILSGTMFSKFAGRIVAGQSTTGEQATDNAARSRQTSQSRVSSNPPGSTHNRTSDESIWKSQDVTSKVPALSKSRFDWTRMNLDDLSEHLQYARSVDWVSTPLGAIDTWPQDLRTIANMAMTDSDPVLLYWGPERTLMYNESYIDLIRTNHPCIGKAASVAFPEYSDFMATIFDRTGQTGTTFAVDDLPIFLATRNGFMEEEYICLKMIPILNSSDEVVGVYQRGTYSTVRMCHERR